MDIDEAKKLVNKIADLEKQLKELQVQSQKQIDESLSKYRRVINSTSEGYLELDLDFKIVDFNITILKLLGKDEPMLLNHSIEKLYEKSNIFVHFANRNHLSFEATFFTGNGEKIPLLLKRSIMHDNKGKPCGYLVLLTELTELKKAQENLQQAEARYRIMYKNAIQGMYQCALDGCFLSVNPALAKIFGFENTHELLHRPGGVASLYKNKKDRQPLLEALQKYHIVKNYEVEMQRDDGRPVWALINARLAEDSQGLSFIEGILIDNTEKRIAEEKIRQSRERFRHLADHDNLTNLFNTRYLYSALDRLIEESNRTLKPFSLVFLDMDNFKHVVDTHGHLNGSQALKEVSTTLGEGLNTPAFGVAYGGDEFVLVLPDTGKEGALKQIQEIRKRMKQTIYLKDKGLEVRMSASFGIATYPEDSDDREGLLALADEAMFRVKNRGKDAVGLTSACGSQGCGPIL
ncbi:sensor domain-containing diguanylate cyclase [Desulforapulum autotrophicum]|nr:sensor domain-containing diguanylate cyclase [Desulforapulum autotrophicum]